MSQPLPTHIPLIRADLPPLEAIEAQLREVLTNGRVTNFGPYVQQLERDASAYLGAGAVTMSSATAGLIMTLQALDIARGSRIAIPSFSFVATAQAVLYAGCTPVFVDVAADGNADPTDLARVLRATPDVGGVILVHMYGLPCRTDAVAAVLDEEGSRRGSRLPLIYDAAHAFGSARDGIRVGAAGDAEVFSTSVTKVMTTVEGGIVSTRNAALVDRLKRMRNYGIAQNYDAHFPGLNGKMSELHAIVGIHNLARLDALLAARTSKAAYYAARVHERTPFRVMQAPAGTLSTYKDFTIELPEAFKARRPDLIRLLADRGVETRAYFYPPIHEQQFFRGYADRPLPVTEDLSRRVLTLPFSSTISEAEMDAVADALADAVPALAAGDSRLEVRA